MRLLKFASEVRAADDGVITAVLSTESVDRDGDIVQLAGWDLANFSKAPRLLSCHDYGRLTSQIGEWKNVRIDPQRKALVGEAHYYTGQGNPEADWAYYLATQGQATYSVGFVPKASTPLKGGNGGRVYTQQELLEVSHVSVPSQPDALQLMAKAAQWQTKGAQKWNSNFMDPDAAADNPFGPADIHCIVAGCDDAAQIQIPICSEHLKYLMNSAPEPPGSPPDDDGPSLIRMGLLRSFRREMKSGKVISAANMGKLHSAIQSLSDVHDAACTDDNCPLDDGSSDDGPPTGKGAPQQRAAGEGSGSAGGFIAGGVRPDPETGKHGGVKGDTTHTHPVPDGDGGMKSSTHDHADGTASHGDANKALTSVNVIQLAEMSAASTNDLPDSAFAVISPGGEKDDEGKTTPRSLRHLPHHKADGAIDLPHLKAAKNALARVGQTDLSAADKAKAEAHLDAHAKAEGIGENADDSKSFDAAAFSTSLEDAMTKALEALEAH